MREARGRDVRPERPRRRTAWLRVRVSRPPAECSGRTSRPRYLQLVSEQLLLDSLYRARAGGAAEICGAHRASCGQAPRNTTAKPPHAPPRTFRPSPPPARLVGTRLRGSASLGFSWVAPRPSRRARSRASRACARCRRGTRRRGRRARSRSEPSRPGPGGSLRRARPVEDAGVEGAVLGIAACRRTTLGCNTGGAD